MTISAVADAAARRAWASRLRDELAHNVLPWWQRNLFDAEGRVLGGRDNAGAPLELPRTAVLGTRLAWTFASAQLRLGADPARETALRHARAWLNGPLTDAEHRGVFWSVDGAGRPLADHKQTYAQAFAIYAHVACHAWDCAARRLSPETTRTPALEAALTLFELIDFHARDPLDGGYHEGCTRDWRPLPGARLSEQEPAAAAKTTNTLLHVLEACTELLRHHRRPRIAARLGELVEIFLQRLWLPRERCFGLFFDHAWRPLTPQVSWGHDIEAAWLLVRAASVLGDAPLAARVRQRALEIADAVLERGIAADGSLLGAGRFGGTVTDHRRHWWCQAEAVVGFWDAWQIGGDARHAQAAWRAWQYIEGHHVDRRGGDWFKVLDEQGRPLAGALKAGPWECPYHHARCALEMAERLGTAS